MSERRTSLFLALAAAAFGVATPAEAATPVFTPPAVVVDGGSPYASPGPGYATLLGSGLAYVTVGGLPYQDETPRYGATIAGAVVEADGSTREQQVLAVAAGPDTAQGSTENRALEANASGEAVSLYILDTPGGAVLRVTRISPDGVAGPSIPIAPVTDQSYRVKTSLTVAEDGTAYVAWSEGGALFGAEVAPDGTVASHKVTLASPASPGPLDPLGFATVDGRQFVLVAEGASVSSVEMSPGLPPAQLVTVFPRANPTVGFAEGAFAVSGPWAAVANKAASRVKLVKLGADGSVLERRRSARMRIPFGPRTLRLCEYLPDAPLAAFTSRNRIRVMVMADEPQSVHTFGRGARRNRRPVLEATQPGEALLTWAATADRGQPRGLLAAELSGPHATTSGPVVVDGHTYPAASIAAGPAGPPVLTWPDVSSRARYLTSRLLPKEPGA